MSISNVPDDDAPPEREPEPIAEQEAPPASEAVPSFGKLVVSGLAVLKGLGLAAGVARVAAPALVGYLAREILDPRPRPAAPEDKAETEPAAEVPSVESKDLAEVAEGETVAEPEADAVFEVAEPEVEVEIETEVMASEEAAEDEESDDAATTEVVAEEARDEEVAIADVEAETPSVEAEAGDELKSEPVEEIEAVADSADDESEDLEAIPEANDEDEPVVSEAESDDIPEPDAGTDKFGLLDTDEPEVIEKPAYSKGAPVILASPFLAQDEVETPEEPAADAVPLAATAEAPPASPEPPTSLEFPSLLDAALAEPEPVEGSLETFADADPDPAPLPALHAQWKTVLPPRRSDPPSDSLAGTPLIPTAEAPPTEAVPVALDDDDTSFDFDPIAIFLQGREEESAETAQPAPQALATVVDDAPPGETATEEPPNLVVTPTAFEPAFPTPQSFPSRGLPSGPGFSGENFDSFFENDVPPAATRPRAVIPPKKASGPLTRPEGRIPSRPAPERELSREAASPFDTIEATPDPSPSPFQVAAALEPEALPPLFPKAVEIAPTKLRARRKSAARTIVLIALLPVLAWLGYYLYTHPELLSFQRKHVEEEVKSAPFPITPVKPDGKPPTLPTLPLESAVTPPTDAIPAEPLAGPPSSEDSVATLTSDPRQTLLAFLEASTIEERLLLVHLPEGIRERMRTHAATHGEGPIPYTAVVPKLVGTVPGTSYPTHLFLVTTPSQPDGFPVSVEETKDGFRVDWDAFVQFNDRLLEAFLADPSAPAAEFFVVLRRTHYFGVNVPEPEKRICYRIMSPITAGVEDFAFIDMGSTAGDDAEKTLTWERTYRPVVRLEWRPGLEEKSYLAITEIVRSTWRGSGVGMTPMTDERAAEAE